MLKDDQVVRIASGGFVTVAYTARLFVHGNGPVAFLGMEPNSFVVVCVILLTLALPETLDMLPWGEVGQTRSATQVPPLKKRGESDDGEE